MSQPPQEQFVRGWFRAEYRGEQQPDSVRVGGSDYALDITRGAELTDVRPAAPYLASAQRDEHTFEAAVVPQACLRYAAPGQEARLATLYNVLVQQVQLREVVYHGSTVYGVLEGEAWATLGRAEGPAGPLAPPRPPSPARGVWRLGCLLPLLTLGVGGCLVSQGIWGGEVATTSLPGRPPLPGEELNPDLDTPDLDLPDADSLPRPKPDTARAALPAADEPRPGQHRAAPPELAVSGPLLSLALSDWSRTDGDQVQVLLDGQPVGVPLTLQATPQPVLLRLPPAATVSTLTLETRSQGSMGVASVRLELTDGQHPPRQLDLRGQLGHPLTVRLRREPAGAAFAATPDRPPRP